MSAMASTSDAPGAESKHDAQLDILKDALYEQATQHGSEERTFSQNDLLDFGIIPNDSVELLVQAVQGLVNDFLFVATQDRGAIAWRWRQREDARKYVSPPLASRSVSLLRSQAGKERIQRLMMPSS